MLQEVKYLRTTYYCVVGEINLPKTSICVKDEENISAIFYANSETNSSENQDVFL